MFNKWKDWQDNNICDMWLVIRTLIIFFHVDGGGAAIFNQNIDMVSINSSVENENTSISPPSSILYPAMYLGSI